MRENEAKSAPKFTELIHSRMTVDEMKEALSGILTLEDKKVIGTHPAEKFMSGLQILAVFEPSPFHYGEDILERIVINGMESKVTGKKTREGTKSYERMRKSAQRIVRVSEKIEVLHKRGKARFEIDRELSRIFDANLNYFT